MSKENGVNGEEKKGGYKIDVQVEVGKFMQQLPELIERRREESAQVGEYFPTLDEFSNR